MRQSVAVQSAVQLWKLRGLYMIGMVKTASSMFPKGFLRYVQLRPCT